MSIETAQVALALLAKNYKRNFPKTGIDKIWAELVKESPRAITAAADWMLLNKAFLPSPAEFLSRVQQEGKQIKKDESLQREREWADTKEKPEEGGALFKAARDEHAKYALMGIHLMRRPDKTREEKLEFFKVMDVRYPSAGWAKEGAKLQQHWERKQNASET